MRGSPYEYMKSRCKTGLWDAFHDAVLRSIREDEMRHTVTMEFEADFPHAPRRAGRLIGLEFAGVRELKLLRWEPPEGERTHDWDTWAKRGSLLPYTMSELREALVDDSPVYVSEAATNGKPPQRFSMYLPFGNLPLGVLIEIDADEIHVTADGRPSSFEEWMAWGSAGWAKFGRESLIRRFQLKLKRIFSFGPRQ
jgi:hypothetical protein